MTSEVENKDCDVEFP